MPSGYDTGQGVQEEKASSPQMPSGGAGVLLHALLAPGQTMLWRDADACVRTDTHDDHADGSIE